MIVLKCGNVLVAICDRCHHVALGDFDTSELKVFPLSRGLLCQKCQDWVQRRQSEHVDIPPNGQGQAP